MSRICDERWTRQGDEDKASDKNFDKINDALLHYKWGKRKIF